ncbi:hypothetical protein LCGC14_1239060 [marine sediment metagenome]|uniref:DZANK-type domain-containing protein n=1 Tax=marine sediment metagenome TaxID=412755 RepID=A0A0F9PAK4_9ZZZZ
MKNLEKKPIPTQAEIKKELEQLRHDPRVLCTQCGCRLYGEYHYCPTCGDGVERLQKEPSIKWALICMICGKEIDDIYAKYCTNCGQRMRRKLEKIKKMFNGKE